MGAYIKLTKVVHAWSDLELDKFQDARPQAFRKYTVYLLRCFLLWRGYGHAFEDLFEGATRTYLALHCFKERVAGMPGRFARENSLWYALAWGSCGGVELDSRVVGLTCR